MPFNHFPHIDAADVAEATVDGFLVFRTILSIYDFSNHRIPFFRVLCYASILISFLVAKRRYRFVEKLFAVFFRYAIVDAEL